MDFGPRDDLRGSRFVAVNLSGARFRDVNLTDAKVVDAILSGADISGLIDGLRVNGVEVAPLIEAELDRLEPARKMLRATDADGCRAAWKMLQERWGQTIERGRALDEEHCQRRVDEEWSLVETLRHLVFVVDAWVGRTVLGAPAPYHAWGLPPTFLGDGASLGLDPEATPSFDEVVAVWGERSAIVGGVLEDVTEAGLVRICNENEVHGYPPKTDHQVLRCLHTVFRETWAHREYAERDLDLVEQG